MKESGMKWMAWVLCCAGAAFAQEPAQQPKMQVPKVVPVPPLPPPRPTTAPEPASPAAQTVTDARTHISFHLPPGWNVAYRDGELSSFHLDARTAPRRSELRAVASLAFNPFPRSTFSGALFYLSATPHSTAATCAAQTTTTPETPLESAIIADVKFSRGKDESGKICTQARDLAYTALRGGSCVRFDLAVNSFCGGEVSGADDLTEAQLSALFKRLEGILETVQFTGK